MTHKENKNESNESTWRKINHEVTETKVFVCGNFKPDVTSTAYKIQLNWISSACWAYENAASQKHPYNTKPNASHIIWNCFHSIDFHYLFICLKVSFFLYLHIFLIFHTFLLLKTWNLFDVFWDKGNRDPNICAPRIEYWRPGTVFPA